jgi:DNA-binding response OmpR family regulator
MLSHQILVVDRDRELPAPASRWDPEFGARVVTTITDALRELSAAGYDAVFLRVDGRREMSILTRLKESAPGTAVVALVRELSPSLAALARESGADEVFPVGAPSALDRQFLSTHELIRRGRAAILRGRALRDTLDKTWLRTRRALERSLALMDVPAERLRPLLVDPDEDHPLLLKRTFQSLGFPFPLSPLRTGEEAVDFLRGACQEPPSLVILEHRLPGMSSLDVLRWIRSRREGPRMPVFVLSSSWSSEDFDRCLALGADRYFVKPLTLEGLEDLARVMITRWTLIERTRA